MLWIHSAKNATRWYTPGFSGRAHPSRPQLDTPMSVLSCTQKAQGERACFSAMAMQSCSSDAHIAD